MEDSTSLPSRREFARAFALAAAVPLVGALDGCAQPGQPSPAQPGTPPSPAPAPPSGAGPAPSPAGVQVLADAVGDGLADNAARLAALGPGHYALPAGTYALQRSATLPPGVVLQLGSGTVLRPAAGVTLTFHEDLSAGPYRVFDTSAGGAVSLAAGRALPEWFGARGDARSDDQPAFQAAYAALPATGGTLQVGRPDGGRYLLRAPLAIDKPISVQGVGPGTVISPHPGFAGSELLTLGSGTRAGLQIGLSVSNLLLDVSGANAAGRPFRDYVDGVRVQEGQGWLIENVRVQGARYGFFCDGRGDVRVLAIAWVGCYANRCLEGWRIVAPPAPQSASFDAFDLVACSADSCGTSVYAEGRLSTRNRILLSGCAFQGETTAGVALVGMCAQLSSCYLETTSPATVPSIDARGESWVMLHSTVAAQPRVDATSRLTAEHSTLSSLGQQRGPHVLGAADETRFAHGPPNWPQTMRKLGHAAQPGMVHTDRAGVTWTCTRGGSTAAAPWVRYAALGGEIRIPLTHADLGNGNLLWWPQEDFVLTDLDVVVTETFQGADHLSLATSAGARDNLLSAEQGAARNLVAGAFLSARRNRNGGQALLVAGQSVLLRGNEFNASGATLGTDVIRSYTGGTFTSGALLLVIRGRYLLGGSSAAPAAGDGDDTIVGGLATAQRTVAGAYTCTARDHTVFASASASASTVTLPAASTCAGRTYTVKKTDQSSNPVTIRPAGGGTVDGAPSVVLSRRYDFVSVQSDGQEWLIVGRS